MLLWVSYYQKSAYKYFFTPGLKNLAKLNFEFCYERLISACEGEMYKWLCSRVARASGSKK